LLRKADRGPRFTGTCIKRRGVRFSASLRFQTVLVLFEQDSANLSVSAAQVAAAWPLPIAGIGSRRARPPNKSRSRRRRMREKPIKAEGCLAKSNPFNKSRGEASRDANRVDLGSCRLALQGASLPLASRAPSPHRLTVGRLAMANSKCTMRRVSFSTLSTR